MTTPGRAFDLDDEHVLHVHQGSVHVFVTRSVPDGSGPWIHVRTLEAHTAIRGAALSYARLIASPSADARFDVATPSSFPDAPSITLEAADRLRMAEEAEDRKRQSDALLQERDAWLVDSAVLQIADAVPGRSDDSSRHQPAEVQAITRLSGLIGLSADPVRLRSAIADARVSGRDPLTALAAACSAGIRRLSLPENWWELRGSAMLVTDAHTKEVKVALPDRKGYLLWDPITHDSTRIDSTSAAFLDSTGLVLQPLLNPDQPAKLKHLMRLATRGSGRTVALILITTGMIAALTAVIPIVSGRLTTSVAEVSGVNVLSIGLALFLVLGASALIGAVRMFALLRIRTQFTSTAAAAVWDRQLRLPMSWHKTRTQTERQTDAFAVDSAQAAVPDSTVIALLDTSTLVGAIVGAFFINPWIAAVVVGVLAVRAVTEIFIGRRLVQLAKEAVEIEAESRSIELLRGITRLRASGALQRASARWLTSIARRVDVAGRRGRLQTILTIFGALWPTMGLALLLGVVALTSTGETLGQSLGEIVAGQIALTVANSALAAAIASAWSGMSALAVLRRVEPVLRATPESAGAGQVAPLLGGFDMRNIVFRYAPDMPPIFNGLDLSVRPGEHLAVVGPSGTGKTTLLRIVLGLEEPESGLVSFDGRDLTGLDRAAVRRQIGTVMQASAILPGSIRENVDLGRGLSASQVWTALEMAAVADDVRAMPMGLNTVVVEGGAGISGGQRQRLLLARALAGNPRILLLDEATSALDNVSQRLVVSNLDQLDLTRVVIAHRLSTIEQADRIVVLDQGRIVQAGTFSELADSDGQFRELIRRQRLAETHGV